jgi:hypothetical protein
LTNEYTNAELYFISHVHQQIKKLFISAQFDNYKFLEYKVRVAEGNHRPSISSSMTPRVKQLIDECWAPDPKKRPTFDKICLSLRVEHEELATKLGEVDCEGISRSAKMMSKSMRSCRMHDKSRMSNMSAHGAYDN